ncbi:MAG: acyltransferase [Rhodoferax sp.]|nr:acyltransferase [Rhodoferax sp.]
MQPAGPPESTPIRPASVAEDPVIEALRGVAALLVVATHYAYMLSSQPGAWGFASTGVDLFFVLSGYVFAPYFFGRKLSVWPHLIRRFFRLYPLYVAALLLYVALKLPDGGAWRHFGVHLFMGHTLRSTEVAFYYNPAFWSLPAEVEYYLLLPLLVWLVARVRFLGLLLGSIALHMALLATAEPGEPATSARAIALVHAPGLLVEFLFGSAAHWAAARYPGKAAAWLRLLLGVCGLLLVAWAYGSLIAPGSTPVAAASLWVSGNIACSRRCRLCGCGQRSGVPGSVRPWRHPLAVPVDGAIELWRVLVSQCLAEAACHHGCAVRGLAGFGRGVGRHLRDRVGGTPRH